MVTLRKVGVGGLGWIGLFCLLLLGTGCSRRRGNAQVTSDVQNRIRTDGRMQLARVQVIATNGVVTLSGYVTSSGQRAATVQDAAQIKGVRLVIDNLRIIDPNPPSPTIAMQKPSASVARPPRRARVPITFEADTGSAHPATRRPRSHAGGANDRGQCPARCTRSRGRACHRREDFRLKRQPLARQRPACSVCGSGPSSRCAPASHRALWYGARGAADRVFEFGR